MENLKEDTLTLNIINQVESKIITLRNQKVLLDCDVAELYGVETMRINEAVKNNPEKFPDGYFYQISKDEATNLKSKFSISRWGGTRFLPKAFTEKGLYMLATILKSKRATETTIAIVEAYSNLRELARSIEEIQITTDEVHQQALATRSGKLMDKLLFKSNLQTKSKTVFEVNVGVMRMSHAVETAENPPDQLMNEVLKTLQRIEEKL